MTRTGSPRPLWQYAHRYRTWLESHHIPTDIADDISVRLCYDHGSFVHVPSCTAVSHHANTATLTRLGDLTGPSTHAPIAHSCCHTPDSWETALQDWVSTVRDWKHTREAVATLTRLCQADSTGTEATRALSHARVDIALALRTAETLRAATRTPNTGLEQLTEHAARDADKLAELADTLLRRFRDKNTGNLTERTRVWAAHWRTLDRAAHTTRQRLYAHSIGGTIDRTLIVWSPAWLYELVVADPTATSISAVTTDRQPSERHLAAFDAIWDENPHTFTTAWQAAELIAEEPALD